MMYDPSCEGSCIIHVSSFARKYEINNAKSKRSRCKMHAFTLNPSNGGNFCLAIRKCARHLSHSFKTSHVAYIYFRTTYQSLLWPLRCNNGAIMYLNHLPHKNTTSTDIGHGKLPPCLIPFRARRNWAQAGMFEWKGIFRLFRFSGILGQPRKVHPKFRNEIPGIVCSIH